MELLNLLIVHVNFGGLERRRFDQVQVGVAAQPSEEPKEGLFVLVVGLGRNVIVLQISLPVEGDLAGLHLSVLNVNLELAGRCTLFPTSTIGTFSQIRVRSLCHLGTFL